MFKKIFLVTLAFASCLSRSVDLTQPDKPQFNEAELNQIISNITHYPWHKQCSLRELIDAAISRLGVNGEEAKKLSHKIVQNTVLESLKNLVGFDSAHDRLKYHWNQKLEAQKAANKKSLMEEKSELDSEFFQQKHLASREWMSDLFGHTKSVFGDGIKYLLNNPKKTAVGSAIIIGIIAGYFLAKRTTKVTANYIDRLLRKPELARETSKKPLLSRMASTLMFWKKKKEAPNILDEVILPPSIHQQIEVLAKSLKIAVKNRQSLTNLLLYGPPGTGKTLFSTKLAKETDMHYVIVSGSDFHQFECGEGITELRKLIKWAKSQEKPTIIFIDEADSFLCHRATSSEKSRKLLNAFLAETGTETEKFMIVCATNKPDLLDKAVIDRLDEKIKFDLPQETERNKLLQLYAKNHLQKASIDISAISNELIQKISKLTAGFSGREISKLLLAIRNKVFADGAKKLTAAQVDEIVSIRVEQHNNALNYASQV